MFSDEEVRAGEMDERVRGEGSIRKGSREKEVLMGRQQQGGPEDLLRPGAVTQGGVEEEELDPRVQEELEKLNHCTDEINRLEIQLDDANTVFRSLLSDSTHHLKVGACQKFTLKTISRLCLKGLDPT